MSTSPARRTTAALAVPVFSLLLVLPLFAQEPPDPASLSWDGRIAPPGQAGERLVITGTIYLSDGETPASGAILYAYQADHQGIYPGRGEAAGITGRHGSLRGWFRVGEDGRYRITTIRPGSYPGSRIPQHIHASVKPEGGSRQQIADFHFDDDPFIRDAQRERSKRKGPRGNVLALDQDDKGTWRGVRDIVLEN